jgi:hypothetical protein
VVEDEGSGVWGARCHFEKTQWPLPCERCEVIKKKKVRDVPVIKMKVRDVSVIKKKKVWDVSLVACSQLGLCYQLGVGNLSELSAKCQPPADKTPTDRTVNDKTDHIQTQRGTMGGCVPWKCGGVAPSVG